MEPFALPMLASGLAFFVIVGILVSLRNPQRFWIDEKLVPDREVRKARRNSRGSKTGRRVSKEHVS